MISNKIKVGLFYFVAIFLSQCTQNHEMLESIANNCMDSYSLSSAQHRLLGNWQLVAEGCSYCPHPGLTIPKDEIKLNITSDSSLLISKNQIPVDTISYRMVQFSAFEYGLNQSNFNSTTYVTGGLRFCGRHITFDSRAGDGPVYIFQKL